MQAPVVLGFNNQNRASGYEAEAAPSDGDGWILVDPQRCGALLIHVELETEPFPSRDSNTNDASRIAETNTSYEHFKDSCMARFRRSCTFATAPEFSTFLADVGVQRGNPGVKHR